MKANVFILMLFYAFLSSCTTGNVGKFYIGGNADEDRFKNCNFTELVDDPIIYYRMPYGLKVEEIGRSCFHGQEEHKEEVRAMRQAKRIGASMVVINKTRTGTERCTELVSSPAFVTTCQIGQPARTSFGSATYYVEVERDYYDYEIIFYRERL